MGVLAAVVGVLAAVVALARVAGLSLRRVVVAGRSMVPGLEPGDRLLVVAPWPLRPGQVVAVADPRDGSGRTVMIKRVHRLVGDAVDVRGDNEAASTDSRSFGPVGRRAVRGRAVYRYHPPARAGWWP